MSAIILTLGGIAFRDFEVPEQIVFGGNQILAAHQIIGGPRVVDALGASDGEVLLSGIFSGPDATARAQALDIARSSGGTLPLIWQGFFYSVIIAELAAAYTKPWWIPYRLRLVIVQDVVTALPSLAEQAILDLAVVTDVYAPQGGLAMTNISSANLQTVNFGLASANIMLSDTGLKFSNSAIALNDAPDTATATTAIQNLATNAGVVAGLAGAQAYLGRAVANLSGALA